MHILVTGGTGYIGSHTCVELLRAGYGVVILDNLYNSKASAVEKIASLGGGEPVFYEGDMRDKALLDKIFAERDIGAVIHFAGLKCGPESVDIPLEYYNANIAGTVTLLEAMRDAGCKTLVFSSSFTDLVSCVTLPCRLFISLITGGAWPSSPGGPSGLKPVPSQVVVE